MLCFYDVYLLFKRCNTINILSPLLWPENVEIASFLDSELCMLSVCLKDRTITANGCATWFLCIIPPSCNVCRLTMVQKHHAVGQIGIFFQRET